MYIAQECGQKWYRRRSWRGTLFRELNGYGWAFGPVMLIKGKRPQNTSSESMEYAYETRDGVLWYPSRDQLETIRIELYDVRAADDLIIGYDFVRDGWTIRRGGEPEREVSFIRSYADFEGLDVEDDLAGNLIPFKPPGDDPRAGHPITRDM